MIIEITPSRALIQAGWDDIPHLSADTKRDLLASTPLHLREARSKGTPSLGSGAIYPIGDEDVTVPFFPIPEFWPRAYALDVGWKRTAAIWGAWDPSTWICYLFAEYYRGEAEPSVHAAAIRGRGEWIRGVVDPAAKGRAQKDGEQLIVLYHNLGLDLSMANNAVESGLWTTFNMLSGGQLKIMSHLTNTLAERRLYRRDEKGHVIKENDHLMDAMRYLVMSGRDVARTKPVIVGQRARNDGDARVGY
jgi:hypothetical protein